MESILSAAFGRAVDIQKGESSELTEVTRAFFHQIKAGSNFNRDFVNSIFSKYCENSANTVLFHIHIVQLKTSLFQ